MHPTLRSLLILVLMGSGFAFAGIRLGWFDVTPSNRRDTGSSAAHDPNEEGPDLVDEYPSLRYLALPQVASLADAILIDARPPAEARVLRIAGARNLPRPTSGDLKKVYSERRDGPVVVFGSDAASRAPYRIAELARDAKLTEVYVMPAGVLGWLDAAQDRCELLGSAIEFDMVHELGVALRHHDDRCVEPEAVSGLIDDGYRVVDLRTKAQRARVLLRVPRTRVQSLDECLDELATGAEIPPTVYFDAYGRQSRYLQLLLEDRRDIDYAFVRGGAIAFVREISAVAAPPK